MRCEKFAKSVGAAAHISKCYIKNQIYIYGSAPRHQTAGWSRKTLPPGRMAL